MSTTRYPFSAIFVVAAILVLALGLRLHGHSWDDGWYFHPDERFIAIVLSERIHAPSISDLGAVFRPGESPLNPRSNGPDGNPRSFAYGTLPLWVTDACAWLFGRLTGKDFNSYYRVGLFGRYLSALLDVGTVGLAMLFARRAYGRWAAVLTGMLLAATVLLIQLAHFLTTDTWITFFATATVVASLLMCQDRRKRWPLVAGMMAGAALATKVSIISLAAPIAVAAVYPARREPPGAAIRIVARRLGLAALGAFTVVALFEPYAILRPGPFFQDAWNQWQIVTGRIDVPFTRQFVGRIPVVYELENLIRWGLGPPLGIAALVAVAQGLRRFVHHRRPAELILLAWIISYFAVIVTAEAKFLRYQAPIVPALVILVGAWLGRNFGVTSIGSLRKAALISLSIIVVGGTYLWAIAFESIYPGEHPRVAASEWIYRHVEPGSTITFEYWDDPLPLPVGGKSPDLYQQLPLDLYMDRNNQQAFEYVATFLAQVDYVILSSDRLAESIPRLPWRYPVVSQYYDLLDSGQLGFQLVYESDLVPRIGGWRIDDRSADESFTVYDHPHVRIYKKVDALSRAELQERFAWALHQSWSPTRTPAEPTLRLPEPVDEMPAAEDLGWSATVTSNSVAATVLWSLTVICIAVLALPLTAFLFTLFVDLGWGFARLLGLLIVGYVVWLAVNLGLIHFSLPWILLVLGTIGCIAWGGAWPHVRRFAGHARAHWRSILASEAVFAVAFLFFLWLRALNPDLWQTYFGGEKPMEMSYITAIARSGTFPPYDPWFAHGVMNYYYYGFYLVALLWKLTGIPPEIGFQLAMATVSAVLVSGVFSLTATLTTRLLPHRSILWSIGGGLLGVLLHTFIANLDAVHQVLTDGDLAIDFWQSSRAVDFTITEFPYFTQVWADLHPHAIALPMTVLLLAIAYTAVISDPSAGAKRWIVWGVVASLVMGSVSVTNSWDMPLAVLLIGATLVTRALHFRRGRLRRLGVAVLAWIAVIGGARLLFHPFFARFVARVDGIELTAHGTSLMDYFTHFGIFLGILATAGIVAGRAVVRAGAWRSPSIVSAFAALATFSVSNVFAPGPPPELHWFLMEVAIAVLGGGMVSLGLAGRRGGIRENPLRVLSGIVVAAGIGSLLPHRPTAALLVIPLVLGLAWWSRMAPSRPSLAFLALCLIGAVGVTFGADLVFVVDDLRGSDWERMNTVFKFYLEAWTLYAITTTVALIWMIDRFARRAWIMPIGLVAPPVRHRQAGRPMSGRGPTPDRLATLAVTASLLLILGGLVYPVFATQQRLNQQMPSSPDGLTLDGLAWMRGATLQNARGEVLDLSGDYEAIQWLREHAPGNSVILEGSIGPYRGNGARISYGTGLPSVLGWDRHERQQRYLPPIDERVHDVRTLYRTSDIELKRELLRQYRVRYVVVGDIERLWTIQPPFAGATVPNEHYATPEGLAAFNQMVGTDLTLVFESGHTRIYEVMPFPRIEPAVAAKGATG